MTNSTGMKCIPAHRVKQAQGIILHDSHAEILALRAFNHFLLQECLRLASKIIETSPYIRCQDERRRSASLPRDFEPLFTIQDDLEIYMYCSEAPCGDCSMELTMANQEDSKAWTLAQPNCANPDMLKGRAYFSELGTVRRKPCTQRIIQTSSQLLMMVE